MSKKERVLIVHNYYQTPGGEDTVVTNEKKMLEDNGHKVFMYTRHNDEIKERGILGKLKLPFETIYSFKTKREIKKIIKDNNIDIVHVHNTLPLISPSVYKATKECGVKVVQTVHNFRLICPGATLICNNQICEKCLSKGLKCAIKNKCYRNSKIQTLIVVLMMKFNRIIKSYDYVDKYICLTEFSKQKIKYLINEKRLAIKPNFTEEYKVDVEKINKKNNFLFVGRLDKLKGINFLVNAWKNVGNDKNLIIIGSGNEEEYIKNYITTTSSKNIIFLGFKKNSEIKKIMSESIATIVPSMWYEPFGMVAIESISVGTPVIASDIGALASIVNENVGIKFKTGSEEDLLKKVDIIYNNYKKYYKTSLEEYKKLYSKTGNYKILKNIYENI